ncbi:FAD-dependent oxidoreductase [Niallia taxi]|uniref:FAD-dependent oxidoreductase n=1 Tax=Niallia taxi TaxID=2499688 RepID=UPI0021A42A85|nr:FAD-dependent oxidoreductase [Niallia taxi]MCT2343357.1 FAD-dependent oxidoreductase [Niallia taxi]MDE5053062.1 FAD-dependent oxidoreductase [Niallia taxi]MED3963611.1 FAD-dependent oxidoreductase [Niallia taxi]
MKEHQSLWRESVKLPSFSTLSKDEVTEVCIVGGGITGMTAAYLLGRQGHQVILLEADTLMSGTTGYTTAKITAQHGLIYDELIENMGLEKAKLYYEANKNAMEFIKLLAEQLDIDCGLEKHDAVLYAVADEYAEKVKKEHVAYQKIGIDCELVTSIPLPIPIKAALIMKDQYQFHPLQFFKKLIEKMENVQIFENTTATDVEENQSEKVAVITRDGFKVHADKVISASHFPFYDANGFYFARMYPERSYIVAVEETNDYPGGMYYSADTPTRSLRPVTHNGKNLILISGDSHKTGQDEDTARHYEALKEFGKNALKTDKVLYEWSAQDLITLDKVPYVGCIKKGHDSVFVATGYRKWGMTNGAAAALLLADLVLNKQNPYEELYTPSRFYSDPSLRKFISINLDVAKHLIGGKLKSADQEKELSLDEASILRVNGKKVGCYKDKEGTVHMVDTTCTHLGCEVAWNNGEKTWDCPCHGSRFSFDGDVLEGPADEPLKKYQ